MGRKTRLGLGLSLTLLTLIPVYSFAYVQTITPNGLLVKWPGKPHLNLAGNPSNHSGISSGDFYSAVVQGLQRWQGASGGAVGFDYWQGTDTNVYSPNSDYNGLSSIYFASNANSDPHLSANVLGLTQVWYNTDNGQILETDIALNDRNFHFTMNPTDTSGYGSDRQTGLSVYIGNVITHELGHAFGLSHSAGLQSTMLFTESPEQAHLGCDEQVAIHSIYPNGDAGSRGSVSGTVVSDRGAGVFGAHVLAISQQRGAVLATALTDSSGRYVIGSLEPGSYYLMVEPYYAPVSSLPQYYAGANSRICGGMNFSRSVLTDSSGGLPTPVGVPGGGNASAPNLVAHCGNSSGASMAGSSASSSRATAPVIYSGGTGFGVADQFNNSGTLYYHLNGVAGSLDIHTLSYSIYSPVRTQMTLLDSKGNSVSANSQSDVYEGDSGYVNYDSRLTVSNLPFGDYTIAVNQSQILGSPYYPGGADALDSNRFMVLTGTINAGGPALASVLPANARCRMNESFGAYSSPPGGPPRATPANSSSGGTGFCGSIEKVSNRGGKGPGSPTPGAALGWILPWVFMGAWARGMKRYRRYEVARLS